MSELTARDRFRGCLLGLAAGDALGTTLEFKAPGTFTSIDDMVGGGPFGLKPGQWTDDTSMALCLAESLIEMDGFDPMDQMQRYVRWWREGYLSSTEGPAFDIGTTVRSALSRFERTGEPYAGSTDSNSAGNGSLMRLAPVPMYFAGDAEEAIDRSAESSRTTHGVAEAVDACRYFAGLLVDALKGVDKDTLLAPRYCWAIRSSCSQGAGRRSLGKKSAGREDCRSRRRVIQASRAAGNQRNGLRREIVGGRALGIPQVQRLPRWRSSRRQPWRRRRHDRRNLRTDCWRVLRG